MSVRDFGMIAIGIAIFWGLVVIEDILQTVIKGCIVGG